MNKTVINASNAASILKLLEAAQFVSLDTETTGLRPYHGSKVFGFSFAFEKDSYYFDVASMSWFARADFLFAILADPKKVVFMHNAKYDLAMLWASFGLSLKDFVKARIFCTLSMARLERNDHMSYSLDACAARLGLNKDDKARAWLEEHDAFTWEEIPGKQARRKNWHYDKVPFYIISEYAMIDAEITFLLGMYQLTRFKEMAKASEKAGTASIEQVVLNESSLTLTTLKMEEYGLKIDQDFVTRAIEHQEKRIADACLDFTYLTGEPFKASSKLFEKVFAADRPSWGYTEKGNPSFDSEHLKKFSSPAAKSVLEYRDAKSKHDFFQGFIYHVDSRGFVHPNFNPYGTATGRLSSSDPNFQNLTSEDDAADPFPIRKALIPPSPDFFIVSIDYVAMEYIMLLELAARMTGTPSQLLVRVRNGADVHQATADLALEFGGVTITRKAAKMTNFLTIYGGGDKKLAEGLGITLEEAQAIRAAIFKGCPDIRTLMDAVSKTADHRKYVFNWFGRVSYFPDYRFCYKALNYLIQGGCADIMKIAMNRCQEWIESQHLLTRMVMTIHDELVFYVHKNEAHRVPYFAKLMEDAFAHKYIGMKVSIEASNSNLNDLTPWALFKEQNGI